MTIQSFTTTFSIDQTPKQVFDAITNIRGWWSGNIEGGTAKFGDEFTYRYQDIHYSRQRLVEVVPDKQVVWLVLDSNWSRRTRLSGTAPGDFRDRAEGQRGPLHRGPRSRLSMFRQMLERMGFLY